MIVRKKNEIKKIKCKKGGFESLRYLTQGDSMGFTITETTIFKTEEPQFWHYNKHLEACLCIEGDAILTNAESGEKFSIGPGVMYALDQNEPHFFQAKKKTKLICVFNPPLKGDELHDENGNY